MSPLRLALIVCLPLLVVACGDASSTSGAPTAGEVRRDAAKAVGTTASYVTEKAKQFGTEVEAKLATLDERVDGLRARTGELADEARVRWDQHSVRIDGRRAQLERRRGELREATEEAFDDAKAAVERAWNDLEQAVQGAAEEFEK